MVVTEFAVEFLDTTVHLVCVFFWQFQREHATTDFGGDYDHSNQLSNSNTSKQFITSTVADDSMVCHLVVLHR